MKANDHMLDAYIKSKIDDYYNKHEKEIRFRAEIDVIHTLLSIIHKVDGEIKDLYDLDAFLAAMLQNRERKVSELEMKEGDLFDRY